MFTPTNIFTPTRWPCSTTWKSTRAHFVGLSMGSYSSLQIGLNAPGRALSLTTGRRRLRLGPQQSRSLPQAMPGANGEQYEKMGAAEVAKATREAPSRIPFLLKDPRGHADFYDALARHDSKGSANTCAAFRAAGPRSTH